MVAVTGVAIAFVEAVSRTVVFGLFRYPGGAVLIYGLSMTLIWLTRHVVPFALPSPYYRLRPVELDGRLYRALGVETFKWLLFKSRIEFLNVSVKLSHGRSGIRGLERGTREAETDHAIVLLVMAAITIYAAGHAWWTLVGWLVLANVIANLYPIMLQRHNRARLRPMLEQLARRSGRSGVSGSFSH